MYGNVHSYKIAKVMEYNDYNAELLVVNIISTYFNRCEINNYLMPLEVLKIYFCY
jgi:hypothetical protein